MKIETAAEMFYCPSIDMFDSSGLINVLLLNTVHFTSAFIIHRADTSIL